MLCVNCKSQTINLGVCLDCIRTDFPSVAGHLKAIHVRSRKKFNLPPEPPRAKNGVNCNICVNECEIAEGEKGYCGLRTNQRGKLVNLGGTPQKGLLNWYYDPLPTNCVADWVCPGHCALSAEASAQAGRGKKNLAVFYHSCTFDCLFCQNWQYPFIKLKISYEEKYLIDWKTGHRENHCN